jgi:hypothetical protein
VNPVRIKKTPSPLNSKETTAKMKSLQRHQIPQEGEATETNDQASKPRFNRSGETTPLLSIARARKRGAGE